MDEQRTWLKARRKKRLRILAVMLSVCVLFTTYPDILETLFIFASEESVQSEVRYISGFTTLSKEIREQTVPVGTELTELSLPDTLEVAVTEQSSEDTAEKPEDDDKVDSGKNDGKEPDEDTIGTEDKDSSTGETEEGGDNSDGENSDGNLSGELSGEESGGNENNSDNKNQGVNGGNENNGENNSDENNSGENNTDTEGNGDDSLEEDNSGTEDSGKENDTSLEESTGGADSESNSNQPGSDTSGAEELSQETVTVNAQVNYAQSFGLRPAEIKRTETVSENDLITGGEDTSYDEEESSENTSSKIVEETIVLSGITWESAPLYDGETPGEYIFTPVLPEGYTLMQGLTLPQIFITVLDAEDGGKIELLVRPYDEENSSDMVYYLKDAYDSYSWEVYTGEDWQEMFEYEPEFVAGKEEWYTYRFRCIVIKDGIRYTACAKDDWQMEDFGIMTLAASGEDTGQSDYMYYSNGAMFNVKGIDGGNQIQTTYRDAGYKTASSVNGEDQMMWTAAENVAMGNSLYGRRDISLVLNGRYVKVQYTVENRGSSVQKFKIGSSGDVMIDNNDRAPVVGSASGLVMEGAPNNSYKYNLVASSVDTLWYGFYSIAYGNMFIDLGDKSTPYTSDSGIAWSWRGQVEPGQSWSRYVLLGVGELPAAPKMPVLSNKDPILIPGQQFSFTGTAEPGNRVYVEVAGEEFSAVADSTGKFTVPVITPEDAPAGKTNVNFYAVSPEGGVSDAGSIAVTVTKMAVVTLSDATVSVMEDSVLDDTWYRSQIASSNGTVSYNSSSVKTTTPGTYKVTYTAKMAGSADAQAVLTIIVMPLPLELSEVTAVRVTGKDEFTLKSTLVHTGGETITETGFVWGAMQNPTKELNNGQISTSTPVKTRNSQIQVSANQIVDGITYYARAYVLTAGGTIYYSRQKDFSINGKSYGTFTIKNNNNNTFTVTRTGGVDGTQKVYFRTVNGSAVGGTHFTHQASTLTFNQGESSKTITIPENKVTTAYNGKTATSYSNSDRTYEVEIYRVDGGGMLGSTTRASRTMAKDGSYVVDRSIYNVKEDRVYSSQVTVNDPANNTEDGGKDKNYSNLWHSRGSENPHYTKTFPSGIYALNTATGWGYRYVLSGTKVDKGYADCWIGYQEPLKGGFYVGLAVAINISGQKWAGCIDDINGTYEAPGGNNFLATQWGTGCSSVKGPDGKDYILFGVKETAHVHFGAHGTDEDVWKLNSLVGYSCVLDSKEPQLIGIAPMAATTYKPGDKFTVSLVFDEIVDSTNSNLSNVAIATTWGNIAYKGGADTNVLYFEGTVPENAQGTLTVNSIVNGANIKDMCDTAGTASSGSGTVSITVNNTKPSVTIRPDPVANGTAKAVISGVNIDTLQYTWSTSSSMPVNGWLNGTKGDVVTTRQTSGTWYLHVRGINNDTGEMASTSKSFSFSSSTGALPELTLNANNDTWARTRTITLTKTPSTASVTVKTPSGSTDSVSGTSYIATENGTYTFTLTSGSEKVVKSIVVSKIDRVSPAVSIEGPSNTTHSENVILTINPTDQGGSGIKSVTGKWTRTTNGGSAAVINATLSSNGDGTYQVITPGTTGNNYTFKLQVTVTDQAGNTYTSPASASINYTVNLKAPAITVTKTGSSKAGDTYSYTVAANGNTITVIQLPDGTVTTAPNGTFTITSPGTYYVTVSDAAGHVVKSSPITASGMDGVPPEVRLYQGAESWTNKPVLIDANIYEEVGIASVTWKKQGSSTSSDLSCKKEGETGYIGSFSITENGTYEVTATDTNGNIGKESITIANIDTSKPNAALTIGMEPDENGWYTASSVPVRIEFSDPLDAEGKEESGIRSVQYKWVNSKVEPTSGLTDAAQAQIAAGELSISRATNGEWYLYYEVTDHAGNETSGFSEVIKKDAVTPTISKVTGPSEGVKASEGFSFTVVSGNLGISGGYMTGRQSTVPEEQAVKLAERTNAGSLTGNLKVTEVGTYRFRIYTHAGKTSNLYSRYVYKISFDSQGGSTLDSQLVWRDDTGNLVCKVVKPADPAKEGYTFGGWYTDKGCENPFDFNVQVKANTTLYAKWSANTYQVNYQIDGASYTPEEHLQSYVYGAGITLPVPVREGYAFEGWYTSSSYTGEKQTVIGKTEAGDKIYYARWKDIEKPVIKASLSAQENENGWFGADHVPEIALTYSDNEGVARLMVSVDEGAFTTIQGLPTGKNASGAYTALQEGEHTYLFKAVDAAGNEALTEKITVKLDTQAPAIGNISFAQKEAQVQDWIIGKDRLIISIPVTEEGSGARQIRYNITPFGGQSITKTAELTKSSDALKAEIIVEADWKGRISNITCIDQAGNEAAGKDIGNISGGILVENHPPKITVTEADLSNASNPVAGGELSEEYYEEGMAPTLYVQVEDASYTEDGSAVSAGIKSITYNLDGKENKVTDGFEAAIKTNHNFLIPLTDEAGVIVVVIKASDHAGNFVQQSVTVKVKGREQIPEAQIDYKEDKIVDLVPGASYEIGPKDGEKQIYTADAEGKIPLKDDFTDTTIVIVKKGDGVYVSDSNGQELTIPGRPEGLDPDKDIEVTPEISSGAGDAEIKIKIEVDHDDMEYSTDGGKTWVPVPDNKVITDLEPGDVIIRDKAKEDTPHGEEVKITIPKSAVTITAVFDLNYPGGGNFTSQKNLEYKDRIKTPSVPQRTGYDFVAWYQDAALSKVWDFEKDTIGSIIDKDNYQVENNVITVRLYAKWRENTAPGLKAELSDGKKEDKWHSQLSITLTYSDNVGVTELYIKRDNEEYVLLEGMTTGETTKDTVVETYPVTLEGEHTYTFKAVDEAGNVTQTKPLTARLDITKPVLGEISYNEDYTSLWNWIIKKDSLIITIPVTEKGSGVEKVEYTLTPENGNSEDKTAKLKTASNGAGVEAEIVIAPDYKGSITNITAIDYAGNRSDTKTIGAGGGGVLVEDNAPVITILADCYPTDVTAATQPGGVELSDNYYEVAPNLLIKITDEEQGVITSGIKEVFWQINHGSEQQQEGNFNASLKKEYSFTLGSLGGRAGEVYVLISAIDQAGNITQKGVTVKIKGQENTPEAKVNYPEDKIEGLVPGADYEITDEQGKTITAKADKEGKIPFGDTWPGSSISIVKKGDGINSTDSGAQVISVTARPVMPNAGIDYEKEELTGLSKGTVYLIQGQKITASSEGTIPISENWFGINIEIIKQGSEVVPNSNPQILPVPARPKAPAGVMPVHESAKGAGDGKLTNLDERMEYRKAGSGEWTLADKAVITGLAPGSYEVRYIAEGQAFTSQTVVIRINEYKDPEEDKTNEEDKDNTGGDSSGSSSESESQNPEVPSGTTGKDSKEEGDALEGKSLDEKDSGMETGSSSGNSNSADDISKQNGKDQKEDEKESNSQTEEKDEAVLAAAGTAVCMVKDGKIVQKSVVQDGNSVGNQGETATGVQDTGKDLRQGLVSPKEVDDSRKTLKAVLYLEQGSVVVTINNVNEKQCTANVTDAIEVANAVLSHKEINQVTQGAVVEIRIDVDAVDELVPQEDKILAKQGIEESRNEIPDLTIDRYIDIAMYMRIGEGEWSPVTRTNEEVEIVIDIPGELQKENRQFYVVRVHEGDYTLLEDLDDAEDTITIRTHLFSTYAIALREERVDAGGKCGLCHICPTFLGICCFIWLAVILVLVLGITILCWRRKKEEKEVRDN